MVLAQGPALGVRRRGGKKQARHFIISFVRSKQCDLKFIFLPHFNYYFM